MFSPNFKANESPENLSTLFWQRPAYSQQSMIMQISDKECELVMWEASTGNLCIHILSRRHAGIRTFHKPQIKCVYTAGCYLEANLALLESKVELFGRISYRYACWAWTQHCSSPKEYLPDLQWSMIVTTSCFGAVFLLLGLEHVKGIMNCLNSIFRLLPDIKRS